MGRAAQAWAQVHSQGCGPGAGQVVQPQATG